ncbi:MAG: N-acetylglucosamine-6-phosphate deacetylase [Aliidongia sp.]|nr:N-acetylglucosamine-6-phosphate deacetylase [Aliidongia sp.]
MTRRFLTGARLFTGREMFDGQGVLIEDGVILDLCRVPSGPVETVQLPEAALLVPGFIDVQVNGGGGVLFNEAPSEATIRTIAAAHRRFGTTGLVPTFITDDAQKMPAAARAAASLAARRGSGVLGLHLEGPFLNPERRGVHSADFIRRPVPADIEALCALAGQFAGGKLLVSLAPEMVEDGAIRRLAAAGIAVSGAHSAASFERTNEAIAAGLSGFTHLFNAMPPLASRAPGIAAAALADPDTWCGIIADGIHVHPALLRLALGLKPGKLFLVTDAMTPFGTDADSFLLYGSRITRRDGRLTTADGVLAGADLDMPTAIRNCLDLLGLDLDEALRMASLYPAQFLGLADHRGRIAPGYIADLTLLGPGLAVLETWVGGMSPVAQKS